MVSIEKKRASRALWKKNHPETYKASQKASTARWLKNNLEERKTYWKARHQKARREIHAILGDVCESCSAGEELQIDHRHGDGYQERKTRRGASSAQSHITQFHKGAITEEELRDKFAILCRRCNMLKYNMLQEEWRAWIYDGGLDQYVKNLKRHCPKPRKT